MDKVALKLAIKAVWDVLMTSGVYPQSFIEVDKDGKETKRTERTEWQEGWNACHMELFLKTEKALYKLEERISDELALLMIADLGYTQNGQFLLNMNDTFYYGSDCEPVVGEEEIKEVARLFGSYGYSGVTYWVAKKRNYDPQVTKYKDQVRNVRRMEGK